MGIGGLDKEFSDIFRRAFASRVFPPEIVEQMGESGEASAGLAWQTAGWAVERFSQWSGKCPQTCQSAFLP